MLDKGLIEAVDDQDAAIVTEKLLFWKESVASLRTRLVDRSCKVRGASNLARAMRYVGDPGPWIAVFDSMLAGRVRFDVLRRDSGALAEAIFVDQADLSEIRAIQSKDAELDKIVVSCARAAKILGTSTQFVSEAVKSDVIEGVVRLGKSVISLRSVLRFQKKFILTEELCELADGNRASVGNELRDRGYHPAEIINRVRVWRRADVEKFIERRRQ